MLITPKTPAPNWFKSFFSPSLLAAPAYFIDEPQVDLRLDRNESPYDWPNEMKTLILEKVRHHEWNRYSEPYDLELEGLIATYNHVPAECILAGPGSNFLLTVCIELLGHTLRGKFVVAQPSFPLYESHCQYLGIAYTPWKLNADFQYDISDLDDLPAGSVVLFASPNNPTGNILPKSDLRTLLQKNPDSYFISDEAYHEFTTESTTDLLAEFQNLIILRTFSKALSSAGLRLGYIMASPVFLHECKKIMTPYLIAPLTREAVKTALSNPVLFSFLQNSRLTVLKERDRMYKFFGEELASMLEVWPSHANFLLIRWKKDHAEAKRYYDALIERGILVRNVTRGPGLSGCLRITLGSPEDNTRVQQAFREIAKG